LHTLILIKKNMDKTILTSEDVMQMTGIKKSTLDYYCWKKKIPYYQPTGRKRFFKKEEVIEFFTGQN